MNYTNIVLQDLLTSYSSIKIILCIMILHSLSTMHEVASSSPDTYTLQMFLTGLSLKWDPRRFVRVT